MATKEYAVNKFKILLDFERGDTSLSQTADILEARTASDVMKALVAYREHLPYLVEMSDKLALQHDSANDRKVLIEEIAAKLGVTTRQVNRMMKRTSIITPTPYQVILRSITHDEATEKWERHFKSALSVIAGYESMEQAAEMCGVTGRQMYRWVNKLLAGQKIPLRDLKRLNLGKRKDIADLIEIEERANLGKHRTRMDNEPIAV